MRQHRLFILCAIVLVPLALVSPVLVRSLLGPRATPITLRYVGLGGSTNGGHYSYVFWVTNHTANNLAIVLSSIQVRTSSVWNNRSTVHESLRFLSKAAPVPVPDLPPHSAGTSTVDFPFPPPTGPWRVKAGVTEKLGGLEKVINRAIHYRRLMAVGRAVGDTNVTLSPLTGAFSTYGHGRDVVSEEVAQ